MIVTTTNSIEGRSITAYLGLVSGEAVVGANILRDFLGSITDFTGGRSLSRQNAFREARAHAMRDMQDLARQIGADAVVGVDVDYEVLGQQNGMVLVSVNGTAIRLDAPAYGETNADDLVGYAPSETSGVATPSATQPRPGAAGRSFVDVLGETGAPAPADRDKAVDVEVRGEDAAGPPDPGLYGPDGSTTDRTV